MIKAKGRAGSWYAVPEGETDEVPCVHRKWHNPKIGTHGTYLDPGCNGNDKVWKRFIESIKTKGRVILTEKQPDTMRRAKYIAIYEVGNIKTDESGLHFDFVRRTQG